MQIQKNKAIHNFSPTSIKIINSEKNFVHSFEDEIFFSTFWLYATSYGFVGKQVSSKETIVNFFLKVDDYKKVLNNMYLNTEVKGEFNNCWTNSCFPNKGPFKYYVSVFSAFFHPTHPPWNLT